MYRKIEDFLEDWTYETEMTVKVFENLKEELQSLLHDPSKKRQLAADYHALKKMLSEGGRASSKAARIIVDFVLANAGKKSVLPV